MAWALAWQAEQDVKCSGCGLPRDETMADGADRLHWQVHGRVCAACEAREVEVTKAESLPKGFYTWVDRPEEMAGG